MGGSRGHIRLVDDPSMNPTASSTTHKSSILSPSSSTTPTLSCPVALHPYASLAPLPQPVNPSLQLDLSAQWCSFQAYPDLRQLDNSSFDNEVSSAHSVSPHIVQSAYSNIATDPLKYDYPDVRTKHFEETPLYHKAVEPKEEKSDKDSEVVQTKRGRPTENPCWNYFVRLDDQNVRCRLCTKVVKSACATNMTKHLERHHQPDYQHLVVQIKQSQKGPMPPQMNMLEGASTDLSLIPSVNPFVKGEPYTDYNQSFDRDQILRSFNNYERNDNIWHRNQWHPWPTAPDGSHSSNEVPARHGVIIHGAMANQNWSSTPSTSNLQEKPYMKRNRKTEHPVWEYFKRTSDGNAQCTICTGIVKSPCSSNFMRHLMRHHTSEYNNVYVKWIQKRGSSKF